MPGFAQIRASHRRLTSRQSRRARLPTTVWASRESIRTIRKNQQRSSEMYPFLTKRFFLTKRARAHLLSPPEWQTGRLRSRSSLCSFLLLLIIPFLLLLFHPPPLRAYSQHQPSPSPHPCSGNCDAKRVPVGIHLRRVTHGRSPIQHSLLLHGVEQMRLHVAIR